MDLPLGVGGVLAVRQWIHIKHFYTIFDIVIHTLERHVEIIIVIIIIIMIMIAIVVMVVDLRFWLWCGNAGSIDTTESGIISQITCTI